MYALLYSLVVVKPAQLNFVLNLFYHTLTHANVWESMGKPCNCTQFIKSRIFYFKSRKNPYHVLQVTRESVSGTTSHVCCI